VDFRVGEVAVFERGDLHLLHEVLGQLASGVEVHEASVKVGVHLCSGLRRLGESKSAILPGRV
jgi:hypothetical protein